MAIPHPTLTQLAHQAAAQIGFTARRWWRDATEPSLLCVEVERRLVGAPPAVAQLRVIIPPHHALPPRHAAIATPSPRPRPHQYFAAGPALHSSHGFPSGHALASAALYGMLLALVRSRVRSRGWRRVITGGLLLLILSIGFSRIYLGAHWPSDVLGGFALGGAYCWLAVALYEGKSVPVRSVNSR
jgi:membrane-associated phospholipid phosphatase